MAEDATERRWAILGCGKMASAMLERLLATGALEADAVVAVTASASSAGRVSKALGIRCETAWGEALDGADAVMLGFKPQQFTGLSGALSAGLRPGTRIVSLLAGTTLGTLGDALGDRPIVRAMPNTPVAVGRGVVALAHAGGPSSAAWSAELSQRFASLGTVLEVAEPALDAITPLCGSGPAYVYLLLEAFEAAARAQGFDAAEARVLARETVAGAAALAADRPETDPAALRRAVTSPGGVTEAALATLIHRGWPQAFVAAIEAGATRNKALGDG